MPWRVSYRSTEKHILVEEVSGNERASPAGAEFIALCATPEDANRTADLWMRDNLHRFLPPEPPAMTEARAREILTDYNIRGDRIRSGCASFFWGPGDEFFTVVDGTDFTADQLEAIAWWMRNKKVTT